MKVNVHSLICIYLKARAGVMSEQILTMDRTVTGARSLMVYSSNNRVVMPCPEPQHLIPGGANSVRIKIQTYE